MSDLAKTELEKRRKNKGKKAAPQQEAPGGFQVPPPAAAKLAQPNQLDQALQMPMPNISALLAQSGKQDMEKTNSLLNAGLIRGLKTDNYGDVQTGSRNPWKNGTFGTPEQVAQRANAGYEQRMKEIARPAGQYNIPKPVPTQSSADFVPRGGVNGVANLERNWNEGVQGMGMNGPQTQDQFVAEINAKYPALASIGARPDVPMQPPSTVPSESALAYTREVLDPVYATEAERQSAGYMPLAPAQQPQQSAPPTNQQLNSYMPAPQPQVITPPQQNPWAPTQKGLIPRMGSGLMDVGRGVTDVVTDVGAGISNALFGTSLQGTTLNAQNASSQQPPTMEAPPPGYAQQPGLPNETLMRSMIPYAPQQPAMSSTEQILNGIMDATGFRGNLPMPYDQQFRLPAPPAFNPLMSGM